MSSILDALKKLERERRRREATNPRRQVLDPAEPAGRRRPPLSALLATAALGVFVGVGIALWRGSERPRSSLPADLGAKASRATLPKAPERARDLQRTETADRRVTETSPETQARVSPTRHGQSAKSRLERARERQRSARVARPPVSIELSPGLRRPPSGQGGEGGNVNPPAVEADAAKPPPVERSGGKAPSELGPAPQEAMPSVKAVEPEAAATAEAEETAEPEGSPVEEAGKLVDTGRSPSGVPKVVLGMLQWSPEPSRRFAFISVDGSPYQKLREGEAARGLKITRIEKDSVTFKYDSTRFVIRPRH